MTTDDQTTTPESNSSSQIKLRPNSKITWVGMIISPEHPVLQQLGRISVKRKALTTFPIYPVVEGYLSRYSISETLDGIGLSKDVTITIPDYVRDAYLLFEANSDFDVIRTYGMAIQEEL